MKHLQGGGAAKAIADGIVAREELFITTKLYHANPIGFKNTLNSFKESLKRLNLDYVDLYLIHWPNITPKDKWKELNAETWKAMEELHKQGLIKNLGVSNFAIHHLEELFKTAEIKPVVNQLELSPIWQQRETVEFCRRNGILCEAWSPLARGEALNKDTVLELADKYSKTPSQIVLNWSLNKEFVPIPKTKNPERMKENLEIFDFELNSKDIQAIDNLLSNPTDATPDILYAYTLREEMIANRPIPIKDRYYLFNFINILKIKYSENKETFLLFGFIPLLKKKYKSKNLAYLYLFGFLKFAKIKINIDTSIRKPFLPRY